ncbi:MAG: bifunctional folylpolyglutamate synthase/dihydrofolate synthase [Deltaproteobacteria bacterium]|jgi:dihydrofolate synthase/folylpolyglutamate synthase|nr:bifunctional folylpolyglutamate synthase/dihydrofolate synthase [Deltaproteobacteria bacterium]
MPSYQQIIFSMFELQKFGMKFGLDSMARILDRLGNPHLGGRYVHIAGTNGKGSTAAMLSEILRKSGYNVGLYTSPHLVTFRERILINGRQISENSVAALSAEVWEATDKNSPPTFFEFVTAMALLYFRRQEVDLSVIEAGLGGRFDSTNVLSPIIAAITNISLEHTEHLGKTIKEIAFEKAGIIKPNIPFVGGRIEGEALEVIQDKLASCNCPRASILGIDYSRNITATNNGISTFDYHGPNWQLENLSPALAGPYQADNAAMAVAIAETLCNLGSQNSLDSLGSLGNLGNLDSSGKSASLAFNIDSENIRSGLLSVNWPGRAETFAPGAWPPDGSAKAPLIIDGAHNPGGAKALLELMATLPRKRLHLILGVMADKDIGGVLGPILPQADRVYLTRPLYHRAATPEALLDRLTKAFGPPRVPTGLYKTLPEAINTAAREAAPEDLVVISGSLFTVGEARAYLTGAPAVESN